MNRTILIANTSNMPVAARKPRFIQGLPLQNISVIWVTQSQLWRILLLVGQKRYEMSGRLEEMPGDEGYPAYLGSRLAEYYERAGQVIALEKIIVKEALQRLVRFRHLVGTYQNLSLKIRYALLKYSGA